ncbi:MAG: hypothetical protein GC162_01070 [Planctomycetes bacterium]|nr:hypothetical protein [Planctomycetota bacterium]
MMTPAANFDELLDLIAVVCDGSITDADLSRLEAMLLADPAARRLYMRYLDLHMEVANRGLGFGDQGSGAVDRGSAVRFQTSGFSFKAGAAIAALIAIAAALYFVFLPSQSPAPNPQPLSPSPASFAILSDVSDDAQFADAEHALGADVSGPIHLTAGRAQVMFKSTAVVDLTGPCEFQMTGPNRGRLTSGKLEANVPGRAHGFTVDLPNGVHVVDLGTSFKLRVEPGKDPHIRVLRGHVRVDVDRLADASPLTYNLLAGESISLNASGRIVSRASVLCLDTFDRTVDDEHRATQTHVDPQSGSPAPIVWRQGYGLLRANPAFGGDIVDANDPTQKVRINDAKWPGRLLLISGRSNVSIVSASPDRNFNVDAGGVDNYLSIRFMVDPVLDADGTSEDWAGIQFGASDRSDWGGTGQGARGQGPTIDGNWGVLFRDNGYLQAWRGADALAIDKLNGGKGLIYCDKPAMTTVHAVEIRIFGLVDGNAFDGRNDARVEVYVDDADQPVVQDIVPGGWTDNFITLVGYGNATGDRYHTFADFSVALVRSDDSQEHAGANASASARAAFNARSNQKLTPSVVGEIEQPVQERE